VGWGGGGGFLALWGNGACVTSGWVDFEHLRFLPTQFTLITAFRSSDNCCQLPGFPAIFPRFSSSRFRFSFKEREIPRPDPPHFHTPCEFILSLALFVPTPVNFIEIPAFWPHYPIRRKKTGRECKRTLEYLSSCALFLRLYKVALWHWPKAVSLA